MNSVLEKQESKLFQPLPVRNNIIPKHIILDTASIINLFCPEIDKDGKRELLSNVKENQYEVWCNFLDMKNKIFKNKYYQLHNKIRIEYTASQRKIESYGKRNQRILLQEKKKQKIIEKETRLSIQNNKSVNYDKFKIYLAEKDKLNKETIEFYKKEV